MGIGYYRHGLRPRLRLKISLMVGPYSDGKRGPKKYVVGSRVPPNSTLKFGVFLLIFVARDGSIDNPHVIGIMKGMITDMQCSLCGGYMTFYPDTEGGDFKSPGRIQCDNPCDPQCHESVKGHGLNAKEAYETSKILYRKP